MLFGCYVSPLCSLFNLLTVFIRTCGEKHLIAEQPVITRYDVCQYGRVGVPDVRFIVHIVYGSGDVEIPQKCSILIIAEFVWIYIVWIIAKMSRSNADEQQFVQYTPTF